MKQYSILIKGTGPCGEGDENSADMRLLELMKSLQNSGHNLTSVSIQADGIMIPILGGAIEHPAGDMPAADTITLATVSEQISRLDKKFSKFESKEDKQELAGLPVKAPEQKKGKGRGAKEAPPPDLPPEVPQVVTPPTAPDAATPQADETGASAQAQDPEEKTEAEPQPPEGSDVQA